MTRTYRGKHPTRIHTVYGLKTAGVLVELNNGNKYFVTPRTPAGSKHIPKCGEYLTDLPSKDYSFEAFHAGN